MDLSKIVELSKLANILEDPRSRTFGIFLKLQEELGEFATAVNIPEKCDEHYTGELADVLIVLLDLYLTLSLIDGVQQEPAIALLEVLVDKKSKKWQNYLDKKAYQ